MIMKISWTEKRTNKWVLEKAGVERKLLGTVKEGKMKYFGHIMRKERSCLEKEIIQSTVPGGRGKGRPRINWMDNIITWTGRTQEDLIRMTEDTRRWRNILQDAAYSRSEEGRVKPCAGRDAADNLWAPPPTFVDRRAAAADNLSARRRYHCCCVVIFLEFLMTSSLSSLPSGRSRPPMVSCFSMLSFFFKFAVFLAHHPVQ